MFTAAVTRPAPSRDSKSVTALRERCCSFMLKTASRSARVVPAARTAPNDEPYSTSRCSCRWNQTRCGMPCTSGCAPVTSEDRHTGVSEGNVVSALRYSPCSARKRSAGMSCRSTAASKTAGVRPSMTIRTSLRESTSVAGERTQAGVALPAPAPHAGSESRQDDRLHVPDARHEGQRRERSGAKSDEEACRRARAASAQRTPHELERSRGPEQPSDASARSLLRVREDDSERNADRGGQEGCREARSPAGESSCGDDPERDPEAREDADPVPVSHRSQCSARAFRFLRRGNPKHDDRPYR